MSSAPTKKSKPRPTVREAAFAYCAEIVEAGAANCARAGLRPFEVRATERGGVASNYPGGPADLHIEVTYQRGEQAFDVTVLARSEATPMHVVTMGVIDGLCPSAVWARIEERLLNDMSTRWRKPEPPASSAG